MLWTAGSDRLEAVIVGEKVNSAIVQRFIGPNPLPVEHQPGGNRLTGVCSRQECHTHYLQWEDLGGV